MLRHAERHPVQKRDGGIRNALSWPWVRQVAADPRISAIVSRALGEGARPIRAIFFDKTPDANWNLGFHQDRALALAERLDVDGFGGWSEKDGVPHAIAPAFVLESVLAVRVSLDDCGPENGPLRVIPRTHLAGVLPKGDRPAGDEIACTVKAGGVVLMKPLLLHASSAATAPGHRRVLHIEFLAGDLPCGLRLYDWISRST